MGSKLAHKLFTIAAVFFLEIACFGQKFNADDFRIVNGTLYNIQLSTNWNRSPRLEVRKVLTNAILAQIVQSTVVRRKEEITYGRKYLVLHLPTQNTVADGIRIDFVAMSLGLTNLDGETIEVLDCGLPNTPENRATLRPRTGTRVPAS